MSSSIQPDMFTDPVALSTRGKTRKLPSQTADPSSSTTSTPSSSTSSAPIPFRKPRPKASSSNTTHYSPRSRAGKSTGRKNRKNTSGRTCRLCGCGPFSRDTDCSRHIRKSCPRNPDAKSNRVKCAKCGRLVSRVDALLRHRKNCRGRSKENACLGRRVAKESAVDVDEGDGDEDEGEGEESSDEADYDKVDGDYVDDEEAMGDDESYADDGAEEEVSWTEHAVACHAEGSDEPEADDADATPDDEDDSEGADTRSHADGELVAVRDSFAASALLDQHNGARSSSSSSATSYSYSPTPTILATSSSSEDKIPVIPAARIVDPATESSTTHLAGEALSSVPSASSPLQPALGPPPNPSPMVQVTPSAYYSYPPPARPVDVDGEVEVAHHSTSSTQQTPTTMSTSPPESDSAQRESDLAEAKAKAQARLEAFAKWNWSPAFRVSTDDSDSDSDDY